MANKKQGIDSMMFGLLVLLTLVLGFLFLTWKKDNEQKLFLKAKLENLEKSACKGLWRDGQCFKSTCIDSDVNEKPKDINTYGKVTVTDLNGLTTEIFDECTSSKKQVNEMWCYESPSGSGNYVQGRLVVNCPRGCLNGACVK